MIKIIGLTILLVFSTKIFSFEGVLPKSCSVKSENLKIQKNQITCSVDQSDSAFRIKLSYLDKLNGSLKDWSWIESKVEQLIKLRSFELATYKPLYRVLAFDDKPTDEIKKQQLKFKNDFDFLLQTTKEIDVVLKKISILEKDKLGYIAPDLFVQYKQLQMLKISILNRSPILGGEEVEKLIKTSIEKESSPSIQQFNDAFKYDLQKYLLGQRDTIDKYQTFKLKSEYQLDLSGKKFKTFTENIASDSSEIVQDIFSSGIADDDFSDPLFTHSACSYLEKMYSFQKREKIKETIIETSLFVAPFLLGEVGVVSRALNLGKLLRFGGVLTKETAAMVPRLMGPGLSVFSVGLNASEVYDFKKHCEKQYGLYGLKPTLESYSSLKACREEYDSKLVIMATGVGIVSGGVAFKNLSPLLRASFVKNVDQGKPLKSSVFSLLAKDFGVGKGKLIKNELELMKKNTMSNKEKFASLSPVIKNKENDVNQFMLTSKAKKDIDGYQVIPREDLARFEKDVAKDTIEFLYIPGADVPHLPKGINKVGHVAMRIGDKVYHQTGGSGFKIEPFSEFINGTKKNYKVYGSVLQVSPKEQEVMKHFFTQMKEKQLPYSFLLNNCSQASCRALKLSEVENIPLIAQQDPVVTNALIKRSERLVMQTAYNVEKDLSSAKLKIATASNRAVFYGVPIGAASAAGAGGVQAVDLVVDYINQIQSP